MTPTARQPDRERGALLFVYAAVTSLAIVGAAAASYALTESVAAQRAFHRAQAFYAAEAGLDQALVAFRTNSAYGGAAYTPLPNTALGGYTITVSDLGHDQRRVTSTGHTPTNDPSAAWHTAQTVEAVVTVPTPLFSAALTANEIIFLPNGRIDSYDSRLGPYSGGTASDHGNVRVTELGQVQWWTGHSLEAPSGARIYGDLLLGPGIDPAQHVSLAPGASLHGTIRSEAATPPFPPVAIPGNVVDMGALNMNRGETLTLPGGTYKFENLSIEAGAQLRFTGPATVYTTSYVEIGHQWWWPYQDTTGWPPCIVTDGDDARNLTLYATGFNFVSFWDAGDFYGTVYAPGGAIFIEPYGSPQGLNIYGAFVSMQIWFDTRPEYIPGPINVHYDEALQGSSTGSEVRLDLWRLNPSD